MSQVPRIRTKDPPPEEPRRRPSHQSALSAVLFVAFAAILLLALLEMAGAATPELRLGLLALVGIAGTVAMIAQARRQCAKCGATYGYALKLFKTNMCYRCGAELPPWSSKDGD